MQINNSYYNWLKKIISIFIELFFVFAVISTLYVFTSSFVGIIKYVIFLIIVVSYLLVVKFGKEKIKTILNKIINYLKNVDSYKLLLTIIITLISLRIIYTKFFYFDPSNSNDIGIYNDIANQIVKTGSLDADYISHLLGIGLHLALFKFINVPLHIGIFFVFLLGTIVNYFSFKEIIGKEKSFIILMLYVLMPSTVLLTFCPTHELFVYLYLSFSIFVLNKLLKENNKMYVVLYSLLLVISSVLLLMVNPAGYVLYIIFGIIILLSNIKLLKKMTIICVLVLSILGSDLVSKKMNVVDNVTTLNTYTILIHGSNINTLGEQDDKYPRHQMKEFLNEHNLEHTDDNYVKAGLGVLLNQYQYLITHPKDLIKLVSHKFYILWSGNHYSIELGHVFNAMSDLIYYVMLLISTLIYLFILTIGIVFNKKKEDDIYISNYKLVLLGVIAVTILSVVLNKYSVYVTLYIYLISMYKTNLGEENEK